MKFEILKNISEIGAGTRGASAGPDALIELDKQNNNLLKSANIALVENNNQLLKEEPTMPSAQRIEGLPRVFHSLKKELKRSINEGNFPLILAGDHSSGAGSIHGVASAFPKQKLGVIWIDAHADLHSPFTTPTGNVHGMPLAMAAGIDNEECAVHEPDFEAIEVWNELKAIGDKTPSYDLSNLFFIGVRSTEEPEEHLMSDQNIPNVMAVEANQNPIEVAKQALDYLMECDKIYITFDVDSLDSSIANGTGTPVPNGLQLDEAKTLITELISHPKVVAFEITEVNPSLDDLETAERPMADVAHEVMETAIHAINKK